MFRTTLTKQCHLFRINDWNFKPNYQVAVSQENHWGKMLINFLVQKIADHKRCIADERRALLMDLFMVSLCVHCHLRRKQQVRTFNEVSCEWNVILFFFNISTRQKNSVSFTWRLSMKEDVARTTTTLFDVVLFDRISCHCRSWFEFVFLKRFI